MLFTDVQRSVRLNKKKKSTSTSPYPDEVIDRLARAFYPATLACWNSEEGQRSLVGAEALHLANARPFGRSKAPVGLFIAALRFANAVPPQTLLKTDEEELCQFDTIPPTIEKQSDPDGERPVVHISVVCGFFRVRPGGRTLFLFHRGWVYVKTHHRNSL